MGALPDLVKGDDVVILGRFNRSMGERSQILVGEGAEGVTLSIANEYVLPAPGHLLPLKVGDRVRMALSASPAYLDGEVRALSYDRKVACVQWHPDTTVHLADGGFNTYPISALSRTPR